MKLKKLLLRDVKLDEVHYVNRLDRKDPYTFLNVLSGLANRFGGELFIGVRDDLTINGLTESVVKRELLYLEEMIEKHIEKHLNYSINLVELTNSPKRKVLMVVNVDKNQSRPVMVNVNGSLHGYMDYGTEVDHVTYEELMMLIRQEPICPRFFSLLAKGAKIKFLDQYYERDTLLDVPVNCLMTCQNNSISMRK